MMALEGVNSAQMIFVWIGAVCGVAAVFVLVRFALLVESDKRGWRYRCGDGFRRRLAKALEWGLS